MIGGGHLMSRGAQTASECAAIVGASPSNCSYHLRELERFGLVERAADDESGLDGRDRPWRPTVTGYGTGPVESTPDPDPAAVVAADAHATQPPAWQRAELISTYGLLLSAHELARLAAAVDGILRPYIGLTRNDAPPAPSAST
jgi:Helix-turn-helix domain